MINIIGQFFGSSGYANHTRYLANELNKLVKCKLSTNIMPGFERLVNDAELEMIKREEDYDINLIITHPVNWKSHLNAKRNFVYLIWEGDSVPDWIINECLNNNIEKIIVPSTHTYNAVMNTISDEKVIKKMLEQKLIIIPHGVDLDIFKPNSQRKKDNSDSSNENYLEPRSRAGAENKSEHMPVLSTNVNTADNHADFIFLMNKGLRNLEDRGGIQYGIKAYLNEFTSKDKVELIVKINPAYGIPNIQQMFPELKGDIPKIRFIIKDMSSSELNDLYNYCDVFVSPTRSEAFNLPCLEALACGKPVITTNFGGQTDFIDSEVGTLVNYDLTEVEHELEYEGVNWAIPKIKDLGKDMRAFYSCKDDNWDNQKESCIERASKYTWKSTAEQIHNLFK